MTICGASQRPNGLVLGENTNEDFGVVRHSSNEVWSLWEFGHLSSQSMKVLQKYCVFAITPGSFSFAFAVRRPFSL